MPLSLSATKSLNAGRNSRQPSRVLLPNGSGFPGNVLQLLSRSSKGEGVIWQECECERAEVKVDEQTEHAKTATCISSVDRVTLTHVESCLAGSARDRY